MLVLPNGLLPASLIAYSTCFGLTMLFLRKRAKLFDRAMISALTMTSGVWLYEIAYHYSWGLDGLLSDFSRPSIVLAENNPFPIYFATFLVALPLVVRQYVTLNRLFLMIAAISTTLFAVWLAIGFPQFWCICSYEPVWGVWWPRASVEPLGYVMNSLTKLLAVVPAFLYYQDAKAH